MQIIALGAEAIITKEGSRILKERVKKGYRIQELDERLRRKRTRAEASLMRAARRASVMVPGVLEENDFSLSMEFVEGSKIKDILSRENAIEIAAKTGEAAAKLHSYGIIHGDLTTSNMIWNGELFLIDFGLGFHSQRAEDKAVDLWVLRQTIESTHSGLKDFWPAILENYEKHGGERKVIKALHEIEKRGRYRRRNG